MILIYNDTNLKTMYILKKKNFLKIIFAIKYCIIFLCQKIV